MNAKFYCEKLNYALHHRYEQSLKAFDLVSELKINGRINALQIETTSQQFMAYVTDKIDHVTWTINQDGLISQLK